MNIVFALAALVLVGLHRGWVRHPSKHADHAHHDHSGGLSFKRLAALLCILIVAGGLVVFAVAGGTG